MKDKQRFERLEVHKETLLEMFKVRTRFNTSALQLKEPCVGIHLMRHCRNILDSLSQSNDNTNNTLIYSNIIEEISLNFVFFHLKSAFSKPNIKQRFLEKKNLSFVSMSTELLLFNLFTTNF